MDYKLAKELKGAGFPQTFPTNQGDFYSSDGKVIGPTVNKGSTWAYTEFTSGCAIPTLEELIEACKYKFITIENESGYDFTAWTDDESLKCYGSTAVEAVARLWLALNSNTPKQ